MAGNLVAAASESDAAKLYDEFISQKTYEDYGILARVTDGTKRYVFIAGLHQQGTWIVAEYLNRILTEPRSNVSSIFFESYDFAVVIWGRFDGPRLTVFGKGIFKDYWWQRKTENWERVQVPR